MNAPGQDKGFEQIRARLQEIVEAVGDDDLPLDDALDLYEEAVALGLRISDVLEEGIAVSDEVEPGLEPEGGASAQSAGLASASTADNAASQPHANADASTGRTD